MYMSIMYIFFFEDMTRIQYLESRNSVESGEKKGGEWGGAYFAVFVWFRQIGKYRSFF